MTDGDSCEESSFERLGSGRPSGRELGEDFSFHDLAIGVLSWNTSTECDGSVSPDWTSKAESRATGSMFEFKSFSLPVVSIPGYLVCTIDKSTQCT